MLSSQGKNAPSNPYPHYLVRLATSRKLSMLRCVHAHFSKRVAGADLQLDAQSRIEVWDIYNWRAKAISHCFVEILSEVDVEGNCCSQIVLTLDQVQNIKK